ncbi:hypothetical protein C2846_18105 [Pseudomonas jilinensis]|uniref:Uncharacterized protein n=1 Tax=Pseudomonas jilinensis TaxID=2078689 RepID=A0A396RYJ9_9PSED|nr:hypothetical protein C2846_18105 [Pseudomonas jilinensis]
MSLRHCETLGRIKFLPPYIELYAYPLAAAIISVAIYVLALSIFERLNETLLTVRNINFSLAKTSELKAKRDDQF